MNRLTKAAPAIGVAIAIVGLLIYLTAGIIAVFGGQGPVNDILMGNPAANVGIPCSAFAAFVIVATLWKAHPPKSVDGQLSLKLFGLEFTGPAGPISLWVVCFLSLILAVNMLKLDREPAKVAHSAASSSTAQTSAEESKYRQ
jgi:hypothetical protein